MSVHKRKWNNLILIKKLLNKDSCRVFFKLGDVVSPERAEVSQIAGKGRADRGHAFCPLPTAQLLSPRVSESKKKGYSLCISGSDNK